jgi:hypothetical protein
VTNRNSIVAAAMILIAAVAVPLLIAGALDVHEYPLTAATISVGILYFIAVIGLIAIGLGKRGLSLTSPETDQKIARAYSGALEKIRPVIVVVLVVWMLWVTRAIWLRYIHT